MSHKTGGRNSDKRTAEREDARQGGQNVAGLAPSSSSSSTTTTTSSSSSSSTSSRASSPAPPLASDESVKQWIIDRETRYRKGNEERRLARLKTRIGGDAKKFAKAKARVRHQTERDIKENVAKALKEYYDHLEHLGQAQQLQWDSDDDIDLDSAWRELRHHPMIRSAFEHLGHVSEVASVSDSDDSNDMDVQENSTPSPRPTAPGADGKLVEAYHWHSMRELLQPSRLRAAEYFQMMGRFWKKYAASLEPASMRLRADGVHEFSTELATKIQIALQQPEPEQTNVSSRHSPGRGGKGAKKKQNKRTSGGKSKQNKPAAEERDLIGLRASGPQSHAALNLAKDPRNNAHLVSAFVDKALEITKNLDVSLGVGDSRCAFTLIRDCLQLLGEYVTPQQRIILERIEQEKLRIRNATDRVRFQLEHCGEQLVKDTSPRPRSNVPFDPDAWQAELMDSIDRDESCLVVAPTSAGKSFASIYVVEHVLGFARATAPPEGSNAKKRWEKEQKKRQKERKKEAKQQLPMSVIFVSPTTTLASQVAAAIIQRHPKASVGVITADFMYNEEKCDILVATPGMLDILLACPKAESVQRFRETKFLVLDEVHMLGQLPELRSKATKSEETAVLTKLHADGMEEADESANDGDDDGDDDDDDDDDGDGDVDADRLGDFDSGDSGDAGDEFSMMYSAYGRILASIRCPVLALSATIAEPQRVADWMSSQLRRSVKLVPDPARHHLFRWTDLQMHAFSSARSGRPEKLETVHQLLMCDGDGTATLQQMDRMQLLPSECMQLWDGLRHVLTDDQVLVANPSTFFAESDHFISRAACRKWQSVLLELYSRLPGDEREAVRAHTQNSIEPRQRELPQDENVPVGSKLVEDEPTRLRDIKLNILSLASRLEKQQLLPAIAFFASGSVTEVLVASIVDGLEEADQRDALANNDVPDADPNAIRGASDWANVEEPRENSPKSKAKAKAKATRSSKRSDLMDGNLDENQDELRYDWKAEEAQIAQAALSRRVAEFHRARREARHTFAGRWETQDTDYWIERLLESEEWPAKHVLLRGLVRGVAAYHLGLPKAYRDLVETLFRQGTLRFIISDRTLAYGINMPLRSVVLLDDPKRLAPLDFVQMTGRAGRRGVDTLGHTVFFDFEEEDIRNLLRTPVVRLNSVSPLSSQGMDLDTLLRLFLMHSQTDIGATEARERIVRMLHPPLGDHEALGDWNQVSFSRLQNIAKTLLSIGIVRADGSLPPLANLVTHTPDLFPGNFALFFLIHQKVFERLSDFEAYRDVTVSNSTFDKGRRKFQTAVFETLVYLLDPLNVPEEIARHVGHELPEQVADAISEYNDRLLNACQESNGDERELPHSACVGPAAMQAGHVRVVNKFSPVVLFWTLEGRLKEVVRRHRKIDPTSTDYKLFKRIKRFNSILRKLHVALQQCPPMKFDPIRLAFGDISSRFTEYFRSVKY